MPESILILIFEQDKKSATGNLCKLSIQIIYVPEPTLLKYFWSVNSMFNLSLRSIAHIIQPLQWIVKTIFKNQKGCISKKLIQRLIYESVDNGRVKSTIFINHLMHEFYFSPIFKIKPNIGS